ncbi:MAG: beta-glucosidase [Alicyclobacillus herbarius]|uniref:GH1 family beta-glucosidase n=1 Tax=Alicyclobacillus herbarius TaxID=122960 RepID=UPI0023543C4D|nr:GH1 family beta-glucosidase [Alicyclobacillus herbarius]MCL6633291.1 beta-glucosidase [Alicyclobacillus herbarius]
MTREFISFPQDFLFGTATASYQIEGAVHEDGRGESIWDRFSHTPGKVYQGHTGDVACDHYHRYREDVALMKELGIPAYRFSIAWPRIFPEKGMKNEAGLDFYRRLLEALHEADIRSFATLYHWDLPQWLQDRGGWANRDTAEYFAEYASLIYERLGDGIDAFITHNEPWCAAFLGHGFGVHAPGHTDWREAFQAAHHILYSHGLAVQAHRASSHKGQIGITLNFTWVDAATDSATDQAAAEVSHAFNNRWFLEPVAGRGYPQEFQQLVEQRIGQFDFVRQGDLAVIAEPIDFLGINFYTRSVVAANPDDALFGLRTLEAPADNRTEMGWEIHPDSLYRLLTWVQSVTGQLPLYITENGAAFADEPVNGRVEDVRRIHYIADHLEAAKRFVDAGGPLKGYFLWSFMDNFEWALGYSKRFGMVYVDYESQQRLVKDSGRWFSEQIAAHKGQVRA